MNFKDLRKKLDVNVAKPEVKVPTVDAKGGKSEKDHQNDDLLKIGGKKKVWIPKPELVKEEADNAAHKVRIHVDGRTEIRFVDDKALDVLKRNRNVTKVEHLGRVRKDGRIME